MVAPFLGAKFRTCWNVGFVFEAISQSIMSKALLWIIEQCGITIILIS